jgi:hypothetical protein
VGKQSFLQGFGKLSQWLQQPGLGIGDDLGADQERIRLGDGVVVMENRRPDAQRSRTVVRQGLRVAGQKIVHERALLDLDGREGESQKSRRGQERTW